MFIIRNIAELIAPAECAGISVPNDVNIYHVTKFRNFELFTRLQLYREMPSQNCEWHNAVVISKIRESEFDMITWAKLKKLGYMQLYWNLEIR